MSINENCFHNIRNWNTSGNEPPDQASLGIAHACGTPTTALTEAATQNLAA
jgi:hypothetical protein